MSRSQNAAIVKRINWLFPLTYLGVIPMSHIFMVKTEREFYHGLEFMVAVIATMLVLLSFLLTHFIGRKVFFGEIGDQKAEPMPFYGPVDWRFAIRFLLIANGAGVGAGLFAGFLMRPASATLNWGHYLIAALVGIALVTLVQLITIWLLERTGSREEVHEK